jgi:hypothetical protein
MTEEIQKISPEGLRVIEAYLQNGQDMMRAATALDLPASEVHRLLSKKETQNYLDRIYLEHGFRNRDKMASLMDEIINQKLEELADTGMGSSKDIVEILQAAHKMKMDELAMQIKLIEANNKAGPSVAVQINNNGGSNYNSLLEKLTKR